MEEGFNAALGGRLRAARRRRGWSLTEVEDLSGQEFKASVLGAYERGERSLSVHRLYRLASLYGMSLHQIVPTEDDLAGGTEGATIDLEGLSAEDEDAVVDRFLSSIHLMRRPGKGEMAIRRSDLAILTSLIETLPSAPEPRPQEN